MTHDPQPITDDQLDAYLDGLLPPDERVAFEVRLRRHPEILREIEIQDRIDASLVRMFPSAASSEDQVAELLRTSSKAPQRWRIALPLPTSTGIFRVALVGLAAVLAWIVVVWQLGEQTSRTPYFQPRPLALVYQEVVDRGFEPYYECREPDRFAATFSRRQGKPLHLKTLPPGSQMLGLSYTGGLTRDTTAMLCRVDGQPVIVFVDRLANDLPIASVNDRSGVHVHRVVRDGLVFYEVTPYEIDRVIDYLVPQVQAASRG